MKLMRVGPKGQEKPALLDDSGVIRDLSDNISDISGEALGQQSLDRLRNIDTSSLAVIEPDTRVGPCVANVGKFVSIGLNFSDHAKEAGMQIPEEPIIFNKWTSAICGPNDDTEIPPGATKTDWEAELGVVIGTGGKNIDESEALSHVAGYCVVNDVSERSWQLERCGTWDKGKGFDTFGPIGPWLVTPDEIDDIQNLGIWLEVDGRRFQDGSTSTMIFSVARIVSYLSQCMSLQPGDVIATGTPPGVGMGQNPQVFLQGGETVRLGIDGLGEQRQRVVRL